MTPERWQQIKAVFGEADAAPPEARNAILARLCENDPDLRREVEALLTPVEDQAGDGSFIHLAIGREAALLQNASQEMPAHHRIGRYRLLRRLGQGGMGAVYEAVRVDDFQKRVALKIIRQSFDSNEARVRFQQERQVLAGLEHPSIARLLDGGESADGSPYLVLEYVDGQPIDTYCAALDRRSRLRLFLRVCEAVEYAHRNLIVHRDLKPANILVTVAGESKLLDFGIAKLVDPSQDLTQTAVTALTPDYASPEQVRGLQVSTASDVYSLGVILYELLTGRKPYHLKTATPLELDRLICQEPPASPGLGDELDHILMMALRKEPSRRYGSVQQLASDIQNYLSHKPVSAQPDSMRYRVSKFVRRNWLAVTAGTIVVASLSGALAFSLAAQQRANRRFNQVRQLASRFLFDFDTAIAQTPGTVKARELVVSTALEYLRSLEADAARDPGLQWDLAMAYAKVSDIQGSPGIPSLGRRRDAIASIEKALFLIRPMADANRLDSGQRVELERLLVQASYLYVGEKNYERAIRLSRENVTRSAGLPPLRQAHALIGLVDALERVNLPEAVRTQDQALAINRSVMATKPNSENRHHLAVTLARATLLRHRLGRLEEAEQYGQEALAQFQELVAKQPGVPQTIWGVHKALSDLADIRGACDKVNLGRIQEAAAGYEASASLMEPLIAADPHDRTSRFDEGIVLNKAACTLADVEPRRALQDAQRAMQLLDEGAPTSPEYRVQPRIAAANAHRALKEFGEAERWLKIAAQIEPKPDIYTQADFDMAWAGLEVSRGNREAAAKAYQRAISAFDELYRKNRIPSYASNLVRAMELVALVTPESTQEYRSRAVAIWSEQDQAFPGTPFIQRKLADAKTRLASK